MAKYIQLIKETPGADGYYLVDYQQRIVTNDGLTPDGEAPREIDITSTLKSSGYYEIIDDKENNQDVADLLNSPCYILPYKNVNETKVLGQYSKAFTTNKSGLCQIKIKIPTTPKEKGVCKLVKMAETDFSSHDYITTTIDIIRNSSLEFIFEHPNYNDYTISVSEKDTQKESYVKEFKESDLTLKETLTE